VLARQARPAGAEAFVWLGILIVATLRSPFLPQGYGVFPAVWLLTMLGAAAAPTSKTLVAVIVTWLLFHLYLPPDWPVDLRLRVAVAFVPQIAMIVLTVLALRSYRSSTLSSRGARI
jgi:alpha-1,2-mannosyltransferase